MNWSIPIRTVACINRSATRIIRVPRKIDMWSSFHRSKIEEFFQYLFRIIAIRPSSRDIANFAVKRHYETVKSFMGYVTTKLLTKNNHTFTKWNFLYNLPTYQVS